MNDLIDVVVESKNRAYQQERLPNIEKKTISHVLYCEDLIPDHYHACDNKNHGTEILYFLVCRHVIMPSLHLHPTGLQR